VSLRVTVVDEQTGDTDTAVVPDGDYLLLVTDPAHASFQAHANGTHVITVKGRSNGSSPAGCDDA
jgi:hypothetical protein